MKLELKTIAERTNYTIGKLYIDGKYFCDTLEPQTRNLAKCLKIEGHTAIPTGTYRVSLDVYSPTFGAQSFYKLYANNGKLPRLLNVPKFDGVLIHCGNTYSDTKGCILVGQNKEVGKVLNSKDTFRKLYPVLLAASKRKEDIFITIKRKSY